jgi:hypothetical protein
MEKMVMKTSKVWKMLRYEDFKEGTFFRKRKAVLLENNNRNN